MGTNRIVYIRTDGNSEIATGHLVRCLSIADACLQLGMQVRFLISDKESEALLKDFSSAVLSAGHQVSVNVLQTAVFHNPEKELPELLSLLINSSAFFYDASVTASFNTPVLLIDSYYITEKYLTTLCPLAKTVYLDDLDLFDYPVDLIINYDVISNNGQSPQAGHSQKYKNIPQKLLGASYAPLRPQFYNCSSPLRNQVSDVLITTGGSDPYHLCLKIAKLFAHKRASDVNTVSLAINFHIVLGRLNPDKEELQLLEKQFSFLTLHENVSDMCSLMESCDLAVSAAGTTLYELCAAGVPTISFTMADNQLSSAKAFADAGIIPCAGDVRTSCESVLNTIADFMTSMSTNYNKRKSAHETMRRFVDGKGAARIAEALFRL